MQYVFSVLVSLGNLTVNLLFNLPVAKSTGQPSVRACCATDCCFL